MKKSLTVLVLLTVLLFSLFTGCAKTEADTSLEAILDEIEVRVPMQNTFRMSEEDLLDLYGIRGEDLAEYACLTSMNGIFPDEVLMFRAKDDAALARITEKLGNRLGEVMNQSKSYDPESYAVAQKCRVDVRGLYAALFVSASHEKMTEIYSAHF